MKATAVAHPNIALIKYWGNLNPELHIPANSSISMNLEQLFTRTSVSFERELVHDQFTLNGKPVSGVGLDRVIEFMNRVRKLADLESYASVESENNFPMGAGIASSASGFAALSMAATNAAGLDLEQKALSRLARVGSGSACRSIPGGFVEWQAGTSDLDSFAFTLFPPGHWDLVDCIVVINQAEKQVSSTVGHSLADSSPLQLARLTDAPRRIKICHEALMMRDFDELAHVVELDSNLMHAVMITSNPPLLYWQPATLSIMQMVQSMRKAGEPVCYTIDAGPNVHVLSVGERAEANSSIMKQVPGVVDIILSAPGGAAKRI